ncbi:hypothetical protein PTTG_27276 [Puccinia triticina 1-1 BBBD Race 1]|uniref:Uncharacterized protein n=1 Tax=Puccinia triticina (isolate 1-1 / race 1 (BBBD)) TaxID=630390 RepID=A0A180GLT2_PUCT1|nr:hypothetical protein PTTG_27276 [Puccinia triticina 1-1 BBBD Race 1]
MQDQQATDEFFTLTHACGNGRAPRQGNRHPQESMLMPLQPLDSQAEACKLFYKSPSGNDEEESDLEIETRGSKGNAPTSGQPPAERAIRLEHQMYMQTVAGQLANADPKFVSQTKEALAKIQKPWEQVKPKGTAILMANLQDTTWTQFRRDVAVTLGKTVTHLGNLVNSMDAVGLVNWHVTIKKHGTYGVGRAPVISLEAEFREFADAVVAFPQSDIGVRVVMLDPRQTAKERETERSQQDSLAMAFGSGDVRLALERTQTRVTRNVS